MLRSTLILLLFLSFNALSAVELTDINKTYKITRNAEYIFNEQNQWTPHEARLQTQWQPIDKDRINFSFIDKPVWLRFVIESPQDRKWFINISYPLLDLLDVYIYQNDIQIKAIHTGDLRDFNHREINHPSFVTELNLTANQPYEVLLRVETKGAAEIPIWLSNEEQFHTENQTREFIRGWVNGILVIMLLYNLIIYIFIKEKIYLFYVTNIAVYVVQLSIYDGTGFQFFWPDSPEINTHAFAFTNGLMQLTQFTFFVAFLEILKRDAWFVGPIKFILACLVSLPILSFFIDYRTIVSIEVIFALVVNASGLLLGLYLSFKGETSAKYFTIAWFIFLVGLLVANLKSLGLIPNNLFTAYSYQFGAFIEMTLLSIALAQRIESAQKNIIKLQSDNISTLEKFQNLYNNSLSGQFETDIAGNFISTNPAFHKMFHPDLSHSDNNKHVKDLITNTHDLEVVGNLIKQTGALIDHEIQLKNCNGQIHWYSLSAKPHKLSNGDIIFEGSIIDINERKENEALREQALIDRMATLEQLAIGICHEINTPLGISITSTTHLDTLLNEIGKLIDKEKLTKERLISILTEEKESISLIDNSLNRVSHLIKQFKQISVSQLGFTIDTETLFSIIHSATQEMEESTKPHSILIDCDRNITLTGYSKALSFVIKELIENSILHSFEKIKKGEISISVTQDDTYTVIEYTDNGEGINQSKKNELFNAFYTTKRGTHGRTGLGLYQVFNMIHQLLRGTIELHDSEHVHFIIKVPNVI